MIILLKSVARRQEVGRWARADRVTGSPDRATAKRRKGETVLSGAGCNPAAGKMVGPLPSLMRAARDHHAGNAVSQANPVHLKRPFQMIAAIRGRALRAAPGYSPEKRPSERTCVQRKRPCRFRQSLLWLVRWRRISRSEERPGCRRHWPARGNRPCRQGSPNHTASHRPGLPTGYNGCGPGPRPAGLSSSTDRRSWRGR